MSVIKLNKVVLNMQHKNHFVEKSWIGRSSDLVEW